MQAGKLVKKTTETPVLNKLFILEKTTLPWYKTLNVLPATTGFIMNYKRLRML